MYFSAVSFGNSVRVHISVFHLVSINLFQIDIQKGMASSHKFRFSGEGDHEPGKEPGDIVIQLEEKPHDLYQRHGRDLSMRMDITLSESLCGLKRVLKTLDKRDIIISTKPGEVIKHGAIKMVQDEGFPTHKDPFNKGRLIIVFNVQVTHSRIIYLVASSKLFP